MQHFVIAGFKTIKMLSVYIFLLSVSQAAAFATGPSINETTCTDMFPLGHGYEANTSAMPYKWVLEDKQYEYGKKIKSENFLLQFFLISLYLHH